MLTHADQRHLIALDLDGTVLDNDFHTVGTEARDAAALGAASDESARDESARDESATIDGRIDPELGEAIRALDAAGHAVVIATGRSVDATLPIVERLRIRPEWVVAANGAVTLRRDPLGERGYRREFVEAFDPTDALQRIRTKLVTARFAVELAEGGFLYTEPIPAGTLPSRQRQVTFDELLGVQASRVVVVSPDHHLEDFLSVVESLGLTHVSYAVGVNNWLDIAPDGVTKASALEVVAEKLGIARTHVFAAGDGRNDIDMLRWAGRLGDAVAMGQAMPDVQAAATRVTGSVQDGGLVAALRDRFPALLG